MAALLMQKAPKRRQFFPEVRRHLLQYQTFAGIIQHGNILPADLLQNSVMQASEAQDIHIQNPVVLAERDQILLRLHRELVRHDHKIVLLSILCRLGQNLPKHGRTFSRP